MKALENQKAAVFIDRDGTVNVEKNYLHKIEEWEWIPGAIEAIKKLNNLGVPVIVITNQAGIARGYYDEQAVEKLHGQVDLLLEKENAKIDGYYFCPHHPDYSSEGACFCRKPEPGMLLKASRDFNIDLTRSFMIGDKLSDIDAGRRCGVTPILVRTGYGQQASEQCDASILIKNDLLDAINYIEQQLTSSHLLEGVKP
jgi:D-glycero-D-manno-heptose 1,7-bisphosphate phosphatase